MSNKKTILIAEDNDSNLKLMRDILQLQGYELIEARDGEQAIELTIKNKEIIDLILMDLQLPIISGMQAIKALKMSNQTKNLPVFVVSAHAMQSDIEKAREAGCLEYITKPINLSEFIQKINSFLK